MKELLIGLGLGFVVGAIVVKANKPMSDAVEKGIDKGKEIVSDISNEIQSQVKKKQPEHQEGK